VLFTKYENDKIKEDKMGGARSKHGRDDKSIEVFFFRKTMGADHLEDLWILKEQNGKKWIGLIFLGIRACGELL
jgi:hypothetical protein